MPYLESKVLFSNHPYGVVIDQSCLEPVDEATSLYVIGGVRPAAHAATHGATGSDPVTLAISQTTGLQAALDGKIDESLATAPDQGLYSVSAGIWSVFSLTSMWRTFLSTVKAAWDETTGVFSTWGLQINTAPAVTPTGAPGRIIWNDTTGTLEFQLKGGNVTLEIGQEQIIRVKNDEGSPLVVGDIVYLSGANGVHALVKKASATNDALSAYTIGMVVEAMNNNGQGWVAISGYVHDINTNHLTEGQPVWLSTTPGQTTSTKPVAPYHSVFLGMCVRKNTNIGSILLAIQNGYELHELHDVLISAPAAYQILRRNAANTLWENHTLTKSDVGLSNVDNVQQLPLSYLDTDGTLAANSDSRVASQKATKTYADTKVSKSGDTMTGNYTINGNVTASNVTVTNTIAQEWAFDFKPVADPTTALTLALAGVAGNVDVGAHYYYVTFYTIYGETALLTFPLVAVTTVAGNQQVNITNIPVSTDPRVVGRKLYRTTANSFSYANVKLLATIANNTQTTYTDNIADAALTGNNAYYKENTTCRYLTANNLAAMFIGKESVALGQYAYATLTGGTATGGLNVCIGSSAGRYLTSGETNVCVGRQAGQGLSSSSRNVLIGGSASWNANPSFCVAIGFAAQAGNAGLENVSVGYGAASERSHSFAVSIGRDANNNFSGAGNTALGFRAGYSASSVAGAYNINIGCATVSPNMASSGQINIGNVLYGLNAYQSTTVSSTPTTTGRIGIGMNAPTAVLHLKAGTTSASTAPLKFTSGSLMTATEAGAVEFLTDKAYLTITTGAARKELTLNDAALTAGQQPTTTTDGRLINSNKYSIYATGTTNGTAGSAVNLTLMTLPNNGDLRFLRITVKAKSAAAMPDIFGRTLDAMWGNGMGTLTQVGADQLGTALTVGNLAAATIATTASGTTLRVTCTDVTGCAATVTWEVFGEYY